ncbi:MAG TPA: hypothetical protein VGH19_22510 [Verrucomicrobiae bacterium]
MMTFAMMKSIQYETSAPRSNLAVVLSGIQVKASNPKIMFASGPAAQMTTPFQRQPLSSNLPGYIAPPNGWLQKSNCNPPNRKFATIRPFPITIFSTLPPTSLAAKACPIS